MEHSDYVYWHEEIGGSALIRGSTITVIGVILKYYEDTSILIGRLDTGVIVRKQYPEVRMLLPETQPTVRNTHPGTVVFVED